MKKLITYKEPKEINRKDHPNYEIEGYFESLENLVTITNNSDDYANLCYLSYNLFKTKFNDFEMNLFNQLKEKYLL